MGSKSSKEGEFELPLATRPFNRASLSVEAKDTYPSLIKNILSINYTSPSLSYCMISDASEHKVLILDVRSIDIYNEYHIKGSINVYQFIYDYFAFIKWLRTTAKLKAILVYDNTDEITDNLLRCLEAICKSFAAKEVYVIDGGINLIKNIYPICLSDSNIQLPLPYELIGTYTHTHTHTHTHTNTHNNNNNKLTKKKNKKILKINNKCRLLCCIESNLRDISLTLTSLSITTVVCLADRPLILPNKPKIKLYHIPFSGSSITHYNFGEVANRINKLLKNNECVLVTDTTGIYTRAVLIWWLIVLCGCGIQVGLFYLKLHLGDIPGGGFPTHITRILEETRRQVETGVVPLESVPIVRDDVITDTHTHTHTHTHTRTHVGGQSSDGCTHTHTHTHTHTDVKPDITSPLVMMLALSLHNTFEGTVVGAAQDAHEVWMNTGVILLHHIAAGASLSLGFINQKVSFRQALPGLMIFVLSEIVGVIFGTCLCGLVFMNGVLFALAAGTIMYVATCEILSVEMGGRNVKAKFAVYMSGAVLVLIATLLHESVHEHEHD
eukprot:GHVR01011412.1.p1 GENE.GHVR01011412.1~~GHVR01011412.1.p1  ORF type:complete len:553 (-),score=222.45 GHVR01011412.1:381-2039(-)